MQPANIKASHNQSQASEANANASNGDFQKIFAKQVNQQSQDTENKPALQNAGADGNTLVKNDAAQNALERAQPKAQSLQDAAKVEHGDKKKAAHHKKHDVKALDNSKITDGQQAAAVDGDLELNGLKAGALKGSHDSDVVTDKKLKKTTEQSTEQSEVKVEDAKPQVLSSLMAAVAPQPTIAKATGVQTAETSDGSDAASLLDIAQNLSQKKPTKQDALLAQRAEKVDDKNADKNAAVDNPNIVVSSKASETHDPVDSIQQQANFNQAFEQKLAMQQAAAQTSVSNVQAPAAIAATVAATALVNPSVAVDQNEIKAKLGTKIWNAEVWQKVVWMVGAEQQSATLTLNPPDLGPVQVVIQVHNDQADTTFISQNPEVRQALQDGLSVLRDMMASNGLQLGEANIHSHEQSQQQHPKHTQQGQGNRGAMPDVMAAPAGALQTYVSNGLVDTFA
jgi:flagellar hook-length control protein FliK